MVMSRWFPRALLLFIPAVLLSGCTDEKIVYRDREPFNQPTAAAAGFLGYYAAEKKTTTCGNCHVGHQTDWINTRHANAWEDLEASGHANDSCRECHSVNSKGNIASGETGWVATKDTVYQDVQCESCHGPGLEHVKNPEVAANIPLANASITDADASCASCHNGTHHPFVEQWSLSRHSQVVEHTIGNASCAGCHEGKASIARFSGTDPNFLDKNDPEAWPVTCTVCHDPHADRNAGQLRLPVDSPDPELNLCMQCHLRKIEPSGGSSRGNAPHAPQGAVVIGIAGYRPTNFAQPERPDHLESRLERQSAALRRLPREPVHGQRRPGQLRPHLGGPHLRGTAVHRCQRAADRQ